MKKRQRKKAYTKMVQRFKITYNERVGAYRYTRYVPFGKFILEWSEIKRSVHKVAGVITDMWNSTISGVRR